MAKRLFIDMYKCDECDECTVKCDYLYKGGIEDHGLRALREEITYALICRRCENPSCVASCRFDALEQDSDGLLRRHTMRCVSCKCCSHACPFGTIYPELTPFFAVRCDYCLGRLEKGDASCLSSCAKNAISYREVEASEKDDIVILGDRLAVRTPQWKKEAV
jgi:Fe-S-cluster-containing hydrogenase component 2